MDPGTVLLIVLLAIVAMAGGVAITLAVLVSRGLYSVARASKPGVDKLRRQALKVRATTGAGPARELAAMRVKLLEALESTDRSLAAAAGARQHTGNLPAIVGTLRSAGAVVERQLAVAAKDPDPAIQKVYAQTLGVQVEQIAATATGVRTALARAAQPAGDADLGDLARRLDIEAKMLDNWSATYTQLGRD
ncbi:hypothetical protein [Arthrobacter sp. 35W]|uniref:hypothetical protein n=1 Tax=Arthrobacter sp. 35W TaxID=1132441 RepID=UPI0003FE94D3|nr:hypothetical protein [Arthrobacter sp. 35W]